MLKKITVTDIKDSRLEMKSGRIDLRKVLFLISIIIAGLMIYPWIYNILYNPEARGGSHFDYILGIPFISAALFYWERHKIFADIAFSPRLGIPLVISGAVLYVIGLIGLLPVSLNSLCCWMAFSTLLAFVGASIALFGTRFFQKARFPLLFLAFMIPAPYVIIDNFIYALQISSAEATDLLFSLTGISYVREGFLFDFAGVAIEVAKECSGIRSSMALIVTGVLAGHLFLDRGWKQIILVISVFPITVLKNGIRIMTLTILAIYVDIRFLTESFLHHSGGFLFYIPGLILLGLEIWVLRKWPRKPSSRP